MKSTSGMISFLYGTVPGRVLLKAVLRFRLDRIAVRFLRSPCSRPMISRYIKRYQIPITKEEAVFFRSFRDFFVRTRPTEIDPAPGHLISPCDSWLSVFPIESNSSFSIKNSQYHLEDLLQDETLARNYRGGDCLIFRLCASDYHHYCYIDDGYQGKNHQIPGVLHSVQPIACETVPVYTQNRRCWSLLTTEHFGPVVQCEIAALVIGGIFNEKENARFCKGAEKGHFEPLGSTIVLLFEPGTMELRPELRKQLLQHSEVQVTQGEWIGTAPGRTEG